MPKGIQLTDMQKSALLEAGSIGSGHAAIALSQLMGRKIMFAMPSIELIPVNELEKIFYGDKNIVQIQMLILGDMAGKIVFAIQESLALNLCDIIMGQPRGNAKQLKELEISALKEVGNIVSSSYLNALSEMANMAIFVSIPDYVLGKQIKIAAASDEFFCIKTEFIEAAAKIDGYLLFTPDNNSIQRLMNSLKV